MIKVLVVNGALHIGGAEMVIANIVRNLKDSNIEFVMCPLKAGGAVSSELSEEGYKIVNLFDKADGKVDYFRSIKLRKLVIKESIDIVHSHDLSSFFDACLCRLLYPKIKHVHTYHFGNYPNRERKYLLMEKLLWRVPSALVAVGNNQKKLIQKTFAIPDHRITTIWNGVEPQSPRVRQDFRELRANTDKVLIGSISTLIPQKAIHDLLDVIALLKQKRDDFELLIVGDGYQNNELQIKCRELGLDNTVRWLGWVENASETILPIFDVFVQSSHWEAMSVVVLEAMASAIPVVATDVGENSDVIVSRESGVIVEPGNILDFARALEQLIQNKEEREEIGNAAKQRYSELFTAKKMALSYESLYKNLVSQ